MKKLGIIGGAGPLASALLYETLIRESYRKSKQIPEIVLINYPFTRGLSVDEGKHHADIIQEELNYCMDILRQSRVDAAILACNTLHLFLKHYSPLPFPFYQLPQLVMQAAQDKRHHRLLILGTQNTCRSQLYQQTHMQMLYPSIDDQHVIDAIIDRILIGDISQKDALLVSQMIEKNALQHHFDGVVLGCTDFPVLHHHFPIPTLKPIYDSIKIPAKTIVGFL